MSARFRFVIIQPALGPFPVSNDSLQVLLLTVGATEIARTSGWVPPPVTDWNSFSVRVRVSGLPAWASVNRGDVPIAADATLRLDSGSQFSLFLRGTPTAEGSVILQIQLDLIIPSTHTRETFRGGPAQTVDPLSESRISAFSVTGASSGGGGGSGGSGGDPGTGTPPATTDGAAELTWFQASFLAVLHGHKIRREGWADKYLEYRKTFWWLQLINSVTGVAGARRRVEAADWKEEDFRAIDFRVIGPVITEVLAEARRITTEFP
jgi:hypothetical protein